MTIHIGFDIGGTNIRCIRLLEGKIQNPLIMPLPNNLAGLEEAICELSMEQIDFESDRELTLGIGCAGTVGSDAGISVSPNITYLNGAHLLDRIVPEINKQAKLINALIENDAAASAYGEYCFGSLSPEEKNDFLFIAFGTGIGAGRIIDGKLYTGANNYWGEVGHMRITEKDTGLCGCGGTGCWEQLASGSALAGIVRQKAPELVELFPEAEITGKELKELLKHHNPEIKRKSQEVLDELSDWIARGMRNLICIEDPGYIVLGGGLMKMGDILLSAVSRSLQEVHGRKYEMGIAACLDFGGAMGAAELARIQ